MMCSGQRYTERHGQRDEKHGAHANSNDKFRAGGENEGEKKKRERVFTTDGRTVGWMRKRDEEEVERERERDLIFSSVIQSSEVLLLPLRL